MTLKEQIILQLTEVLKTLHVPDVLPLLDYPPDPTQGDYATNVAFAVAKALQMSPMEAAEKVKSELEIGKLESGMFKKVEVAKPGFINFWIRDEYLVKHISQMGTQDDTQALHFTNQKIMFEFTDPNPFKEFHIGHLYTNVVGESISRLLEANGATVWRVTYQGDVGLHVAKALWGGLEKLKVASEKLQAQDNNEVLKDLENQSLEARAKFLGEAYALGAKAYEENEKSKEEIIALNKKIYEQDASIKELYVKGKQWSLEYFAALYKRLGTTFVKNYFESEAGPIGLQVVRENMQNGTFVESEGVVVFTKEKSGLHTRVFINSQGLPTYEAKELGLAPTKYKDFPYDLSLILTGNEINEYFKVLLKALSLISPDLAAKTKHLSHGMVRLPEGKMSSRTGNVLTAEWLLEETKSRISQQYPEMEPDTLEKVTISAIKYALLKSGLGRDVEFSFQESISFEGSSGPYLQYTYARTQSVLHKYKMLDERDVKITEILHLRSSILHPEERHLLVLLVRFSEVVAEAGKKFAPNILCSYLFDLAQTFNLFYQKHQILKAEGEERAFRLFLTEKTGEVMKKGLELLGIKAPERM